MFVYTKDECILKWQLAWRLFPLFIFIYVSKFAHRLLFSESEKGARFGKMASASWILMISLKDFLYKILNC